MNDLWDPEQIGFTIKAVPTFIEYKEALKLENSELEFRLTNREINNMNHEYQHILVLNEFRINSRSEIFKHFYELLRTPPTVNLRTEAGTHLNELPNLVNVTGLELYGLPVVKYYVEDYFGRCDELNNAVVGNGIDSMLNENSKLTFAKNLFFGNSEMQAMFLPFHFKGQVASFNKSICDSHIVISLLQQWMNSEALLDLDYLQISLMTDYNFNHLHVHQEIESEPWDQIRRPARYEKRTRIIEWEFRPFNCEHYLDVTRRSDGMIGSFLITQRVFTFCVWK